MAKETRKFSVLLPTRNRLDLAKGAIETVRCQTYKNWELIVADNCSDEDVAGYIGSLSDSRIIFTRSDKPLPVTENWNRALDASSSDYVVMLGDDDGLVPGYFERLLKINDALDNPDFIYHGAYHFAFPGVLPSSPRGALTDVTSYQSILRNRPNRSLLAPEQARAIVRAALDMRAHYAFNMQHFLFNRRFLNRMSQFGFFFQGPFPDFYAANMSMLMAERIGLLAEPVVIIGISPKSYGFYHFNKQEKGGIDFLNAGGHVDGVAETLRRQLLPGTNMNSSWLISVAMVSTRLGSRADLKLNVARYRRLQIIHNLKRRALGEPAEASLADLWPHLNWREGVFAIGLKTFLLPALLLTGRFRAKWVGLTDAVAAQYLPLPANRPQPVVGRYKTIQEVFEALRTSERSSPEKAVCSEIAEQR